MAEPKAFDFDWDRGGVIDWVATGYGTRSWQNPHETGDVIVRVSSKKSGNIAEFVDSSHSAQSLCTDNEKFSWIDIELPVAVSPTHYRMSHGGASTKNLLRSWAFCASYDGEDWRVLCQHMDDETLLDESKETLTGAWEVQMRKPEYYPFFRIVIFEGGNLEKTNTLVASCFEIFGSVRHRAWPQ